MSEKNRNNEMSCLHEKILYVVADGERKDTVTSIFYVGWVVSGLAILVLALNYGRDAAMMALLAVAIAGSILLLINTWWKHRLQVKYSPDEKVHRQLSTE
jgi:hypothetical protein